MYESEKSITSALSCNSLDLIKETRWLVKLPLESNHVGHIMGEVRFVIVYLHLYLFFRFIYLFFSVLQNAGIMQQVDSVVIAKIHDLVKSGINNISQIQLNVSHYVMNDLFKDVNPPKPCNRRFFPLKSDIRNHYNSCFRKLKLAKMDQEHLSKLIEQWKAAGDKEDKMFFRPYIAGEDTVVCNNNIDDDDMEAPIIHSKQTLLFVHQFKWQQRLLQRYGQDICLLDATYKTSKYALPLFFLCVKTNIGYIVVASFVLQNETAEDIEEALQFLKLWNPHWNPTFFMTDKCEAEIKAIENCFLGEI